MREHKGVRVGDTVCVVGWRWPGSEDYRRVEGLFRCQCQTGVMVRLSGPLQNGSTNVDFAWLKESRT